MDENTKKIRREIAKDKIQIILSGIAVAVLIIMELYIMINYQSNFMFMAAGILLMIVALFFLISAVLDISLRSKDMEAQKYEEIYNAQKASYLVIKKSFDEMDQRLRNIEENSSLPAEDIINAQKAVAKVTISRSKENTDALMNSNDELINQLFSIKEKIESNNNQIIEKQQALIKETNFDIQQKIAALTSQISNIEGKIQNGIPVMAQPIQMVAPTYEAPPVAPATPMPELTQELVTEEMPTVAEEAMIDLDISIEEEQQVEAMEEPVEGIDLEMPSVEETVPEEISEEAPVEDIGIELEVPVEDIGLDIEAPVEEAPMEEPIAEEPVEDLGLDIDAEVSEEAIEEPNISEEPTEDLGIDIDLETSEEPVAEEPLLEEPITEESIPEEILAEETSEDIPEEVVEESDIEIPSEEVSTEAEVANEEAEEEIILESTSESEEIVLTNDAPQDVDLDALLEEVGGPAEEEPVEKTPEPEPEPKQEEEIVIPDVGVDLTDPNRVMSAEEIEKLFANI